MVLSINNQSSKYPDDDLFFTDLINSYLESNRFVERHWLLKKIEKHLTDPDCRVVLLTAEPGAGKTAFVAWLANQHTDWPRYFIRKDSKELLRGGDAQSFLLTVGHQMASSRPSIFESDNLKIVVEENLEKIESGSSVVGLQTDELYASPFNQTWLSVKLGAKTVEGSLAGISAKKLVTHARLLTNEKLQHLALFDPAKVLLRENPAAKIIIIIDGLDELKFQNSPDDILKWLLDLAIAEIPSNILFLITSRPLEEHNVNILREHYGKLLREDTIDTSSEDVQEDLHTYAERFVSQESIKSVFRLQGIDSNKFVKESVTKAQGNFQYLAFLYRGIEQQIIIQTKEGEDDQRKRLATAQEEVLIKLLRFEGVPARLKNLYAFFLDMLKASVYNKSIEVRGEGLYGKPVYVPAWEALYQPILGVMAVAMEPLDSVQIKNFIGFTGEDRWLNAALDNMGPFLDHPTRSTYTLYHITFSEFLTTPLIPSDGTSNDGRYYYINPLESHRSIVRYYRIRTKNWENVNWKNVDNYGLRKLSSHIYSLKDEEVDGVKPYRQELYNLICKPFMQENLERFISPHYFVKDIELAIEAAASDETPNLVQVVRGLFIQSILKALSTKIPPEALWVLVRLNKKATALGFAALMDTSLQIKAYHLIADALLDCRKIGEAKDIILQVLELVENIKADVRDQSEWLSRIGDALVIVGEMDKVLTKVRKYESDYRIRTFAIIAYKLAARGKFNQALEIVKEIESGQEKDWVLRDIVNLAARKGKFKLASRMAQDVRDPYLNALTITDISHTLAKIGKSEEAYERANHVLKMTELFDDQLKVPVLLEVLEILIQIGKIEEANPIASHVMYLIDLLDNNSLKVTVMGLMSKTLIQIGKKDVVSEIRHWMQATAAEILKKAIETRTIQDIPENQQDMLIGISRMLVKLRDFQTPEALASIIDRLENYSLTREIREGILIELADMEEWGEVREIVVKKSEITKDLTIGRIAKDLANSTQFDKALSMIEMIEDDDDYNYGKVFQIIAHLAVYVCDREKLKNIANRMQTLMKKFENKGRYATAESAVAMVLVLAGMNKDSEIMINNVLSRGTELHSREEKHDEFEVLKVIAETLTKVGKIEEALKVVEGMKIDLDRVSTLERLAEVLSNLDMKTKVAMVADIALATATRNDSSSDRNVMLRYAAIALTWAGDIEGARSVVERINGESSKQYASIGIVDVLSRMKKYDEAIELAKLIINQTDDVSPTVRAMSMMPHKVEMHQEQNNAQGLHRATDEAIMFAYMEKFDRAFNIINSLKRGYEKDSTLGYIAEIMIQQHAFKQAIETSKDIEDKHDKARTMIKVAQSLVKSGKKLETTEVVNQLLESAETLYDGITDIELLEVMASLDGSQVSSFSEEVKRKFGTQVRADQAIYLVSYEALALAKACQVNEAISLWTRKFIILQSTDEPGSRSKRSNFFDLLLAGVPFISILNNGQTLWKIYEAITEVESWWNIKQTATK